MGKLPLDVWHKGASPPRTPTHTYVCTYIYLYIYIYRERERYIYIYIYTCIYIYIYIYVYTRLHICIYVHVYTYMYVYVYIYTCVMYLCTCIFIGINRNIRVSLSLSIYIYIYILPRTPTVVKISEHFRFVLKEVFENRHHMGKFIKHKLELLKNYIARGVTIKFCLLRFNVLFELIVGEVIVKSSYEGSSPSPSSWRTT